MRLLSRTLFREVFASATLGWLLFTSVIFLYLSRTIFQFVVQNPGPPKIVAKLFLLVIPQALPYTIPLGVLVGVLLALSRKSTDGEITAMRAAGISGRRVLPAILALGFLSVVIAFSASLWLTPWSIREMYRLRNVLAESQLHTDIQPQSFDERFPDTVLYVREIKPGPTSLWRQVLVIDLKPSAERGEIPKFTVAKEAIAQPDAEHNRIQLTLRNGSTYEANKDVTKYEASSFATNDLALEAEKPSEERASRHAREMDTVPLYRFAYKNREADAASIRDARVELHERFALPLACLVFALIAVPLGLSSRRRGKSPAVVITVALAFLYYLGLITSISVSQQGTLPVELAMWLPDIVFAVLGLLMLTRLERPGSRDYLDALEDLFRRPARTSNGKRALLPRLEFRRFHFLPQIVDSHITARFIFYFLMWLVTFILLLDVFTFFEILTDIVRNRTPLATVASYLFFLTPRWIYELTPISVLTSVLVVLGVMSKNNEITAFKACGISVYRLAVPLFIAGLLLSGALFAFNHYVVPTADRRQNALRAEIKGRPAQTFLDPSKKWIYGMDDRVYYYRFYDANQDMMAGVNVFELDPDTFKLRRHIAAETARWDREMRAWVFENGWSRDVEGNVWGALDNFAGDARIFPEIEERPEYFKKEKIDSEQMNYKELAAYIEELRQGGFNNNTIPLRVQYFKKFSVPLFAFILALVSVPFAFRVGGKGAMAGVGISFAIFLAYSTIQQLFEQVGSLGQLPPDYAAWAPNAIFSLTGLFFFMRLRS
jgi:LPS export ABC transporter permease LptF/LPS export ABC transporter permease LptG